MKQAKIIHLDQDTILTLSIYAATNGKKLKPMIEELLTNAAATIKKNKSKWKNAHRTIKNY